MNNIGKYIIGISIITLLIALLTLLSYGNINKNEENHGVEQLTNKYERDYELQLKELVIWDGDIIDDSIASGIYVPKPSGKKYRYRNISRLYRSLVDFFDESVQKYYYFENAVAQLATTKYISISAMFSPHMDIPHCYAFTSCVTIDLEQEKEVFLNDLIEINDEFIYLLKSGYLAKTYDNLDDRVVVSVIDFSAYTEEELRTKLEDCFRPMNEVDVSGGLYEYYLKPSFYLAPNQICFVNFHKYGLRETFYVQLDDIEKFLKVEKW